MPETTATKVMTAAFTKALQARMDIVKRGEIDLAKVTVEKRHELKCDAAEIAMDAYRFVTDNADAAVTDIANSAWRKAMGIETSGKFLGRSFLTIAEDLDCLRARPHFETTLAKYVKASGIEAATSIREVMPALRAQNRKVAGLPPAAGGNGNSPEAEKRQALKIDAFNYGVTDELAGISAANKREINLAIASGVVKVDELRACDIDTLTVIRELLLGIMADVRKNGVTPVKGDADAAADIANAKPAPKRAKPATK